MSSRYTTNSYQPSQVDASGFAVPYAISYKTKPKPIGGIVTSTYVSSSSSTTISSNDTLRFEISRRDFLAASNLYLETILETTSTDALGASSVLASMPYFSFVIRRLQTEVGSTVIDSINDYGDLYGALAKLNINTAYGSTDATFEGKGRAVLAANTTPGTGAPNVWGGVGNTQKYVSPLLGILQSEKALPLMASNASVVITLEFINPVKLFGVAAAGNGANYRLREPKLFIERIDPGEIYKREFSMALNAAGALRIPYVTFSGQSFGVSARQGTFTQIIQENCNSLLGILMVIRDNATPGEHYCNAQFKELEVRVDGVLTPSYIIQGNSQMWAESSRLVSALWDTNSSGSVTYQKYSSLAATGVYNSANEGDFVAGVNFKRYTDDSTMSGLGIPVRSGVEIRMEGLDIGANKAMTVEVFLIKEQNMVVTTTGEVGVQK